MNNRIVATKIYVQWSDNPKLIALNNEMPKDLEELFNQWLHDIEEEQNATRGE